MTEHTAYALGQALPSQAVVRGLQGWFDYRRFPVFSLPWLGRRLLVFGLPIAALALMSLLGLLAASRDPLLALMASAMVLFGFLSIAFCGPLLASAVRYRRWPLRRERVAVVLAVLLGMLASYAIDGAVSARLDPLVEQRIERSGMLPAEMGARAKAQERSTVGIAANLMFLSVIYFLLGGGLSLRGYFSEQRRVLDSQHEAELATLRLSLQQSALRMSLLQAQLAPHFLFNTLASMRALLRRDPERAEATLDALVDHLRACMPRLAADGELGVSTLGRELEACRSYLELMKLRLGHRFSYTVDTAGPFEARPLLPMLVLTLVENAVKHGIEPLPGPGEIQVRVHSDAGNLHLIVEDSGVGLQPGLSSGVGLANLRSQLRDRYGGLAALRLTDRAPEPGVRAEIVLPMDEPQRGPAR